MLLDLLNTRRSIREFTEQPITKEQLEYLQETVMRAPTSRGLNPWQFVFVTDPQVIAKLAEAKPKGAAFIANCALAVVICADTTCSDVWVEDCSIAAICLQLAATELGLGSCWSQMRLRQHNETTSASDFICSLLDLSQEIEVDNIIGIGNPAEHKEPHPQAELPWAQISNIAL